METFQKIGRFLSETVPLLRNRFHKLRSFHGKLHRHPPLFFSTLSPCRGEIHPSRGVCRHYAIHFFVELQGPHLCGPRVYGELSFAGKPRAGHARPLPGCLYYFCRGEHCSPAPCRSRLLPGSFLARKTATGEQCSPLHSLVL